MYFKCQKEYCDTCVLVGSTLELQHGLLQRKIYIIITIIYPFVYFLNEKNNKEIEIFDINLGY